ncbi:putative membrane protein [Pseudarthrobacter oxydans]|uniref:hypothetical protein n=1 Tax=Pseudarthrobacter oxydans TaxID=1671 RepID=UPI002781134F|nr:hypothetical protein [Pseudarthrobacter oxydans]MDP9982950.1 putative membrane protein [Pseudarthrobacter oxydans]
MQFKRSAGIFVAGISLIFCGPLLTFIGTTFGTWSAASKSDSGLNAVFIGLAVFGLIAGFVGVIMLVVAAHRALVKIDAIPVRVQSAPAGPRSVLDRR